MKRCVTHCGLCKPDNKGESSSFHVSRPKVSYLHCVFRHAEPLGRGEYEVMVRDNGMIAGTVCYRSRIMPKTRMGRKRGMSGGVL